MFYSSPSLTQKQTQLKVYNIRENNVVTRINIKTFQPTPPPKKPQKEKNHTHKCFALQTNILFFKSFWLDKYKHVCAMRLQF